MCGTNGKRLAIQLWGKETTHSRSWGSATVTSNRFGSTRRGNRQLRDLYLSMRNRLQGYHHSIFVGVYPASIALSGSIHCLVEGLCIRKGREIPPDDLILSQLQTNLVNKHPMWLHQERTTACSQTSHQSNLLVPTRVLHMCQS